MSATAGEGFQLRRPNTHGTRQREKGPHGSLPQTIVPELTSQLEVVKKIHDEDLAADMQEFFSMTGLKRNILGSQGFVWQWCFPQKTLTQVSTAQELRDIIARNACPGCTLRGCAQG